MTGIEALNAICAECQRDKGKIQVACPWRSISGDYCEEYETIKRCIERLAELEDKIESRKLVELNKPFIDEDEYGCLILQYQCRAIDYVVTRAEAEKKLKELKGEEC